MEIGNCERGVLRLEGALNIQDAARLREALLAALTGAQTLALDLTGVTEADVSCLQVLCAAHKSFLAANKELLTTGDPAEPFLRAVDDSGFRRTTGCHSDPARGCLWVRGGNRG